MKICINCDLSTDDMYTYCPSCGRTLISSDESEICRNCMRYIKKPKPFFDEYCPFCSKKIWLNSINLNRYCKDYTLYHEHLAGLIFKSYNKEKDSFDTSVLSEDEIKLLKCRFGLSFNTIINDVQKRLNRICKDEFIAICKIDDSLKSSYESFWEGCFKFASSKANEDGIDTGRWGFAIQDYVMHLMVSYNKRDYFGSYEDDDFLKDEEVEAKHSDEEDYYDSYNSFIPYQSYYILLEASPGCDKAAVTLYVKGKLRYILYSFIKNNPKYQDLLNECSGNILSGHITQTFNFRKGAMLNSRLRKKWVYEPIYLMLKKFIDLVIDGFGESEDEFEDKLMFFITDFNKKFKRVTDFLNNEYCLERLFKTFQPREREVLEMRLGLRNGKIKDYEEIGQYYGVTRVRIQMLEAKGLRHLRGKIVKYMNLGFKELVNETGEIKNEEQYLKRVKADFIQKLKPSDFLSLFDG